MDSNQLSRAMLQNKSTKDFFLGVFASDHLPIEIKSYPACFIVNTDPSSEAGSHWLCFYFPCKHVVEFFDSYGNPPAFFGDPIANFTSRFSFVYHNPLRLQSNSTAVCGQYCVYYLYSRCRGKTMNDVLSSFVSNHICNDNLVYNFVSKVFHVRVNFYQ